MTAKPRLLWISYRFPPQTYPLATRVKYFLSHLEGEWEIDAVTAAEETTSRPGVSVHHVPERTPRKLFETLRRLRLDKLTELLAWPDPFLFWVWPAFQAARALLRKHEYDAIAVFMMPYSQGLIGMLLKSLTGLPLIMNFNDSMTCSDMRASVPSVVHHHLDRLLEDLYVRTADAVIFVSKHNLERVRARQPHKHRDKFHLIRRGSSRIPASAPMREPSPTFRILYTGGTNGWYRHWEDLHPASSLKQTKRWIDQLGRYQRTDLDDRTHGPVYLGFAIQRVLERHPEWAGRIWVDVYGKRYPDGIDEQALHALGLGPVVQLHPPIPHDDALRLMPKSDLLFMALPDRLDGTRGGRISAKTYEYLMTDRPILGALPPGENTEYLRDKPGTHCVSPADVEGMASVIERLAHQKLAEGHSLAVDRSDLTSRLTGEARAAAFDTVLRNCVAAIDSRPARSSASLSPSV